MLRRITPTPQDEEDRKAIEKWAKDFRKNFHCGWCDKPAWNDDFNLRFSRDYLESARVQHYEWVTNILEHNVPGEISVVHSILEYLFPVVYGQHSSRPLLLQSPTKKLNNYHITCLTISSTN